MKSLIKMIAVLMMAAAFVGCASGPKYEEIAKTIPELSPDMARIYIYRTAVLGAAVQPSVRVNDEVVGKAVPKGFFFVDRTPGNYKIKTSTEVDRHLSLVLEPGQTRYVRLNISMGFFVGHVYPELVEETVGKQEISGCSYADKK